LKLLAAILLGGILLFNWVGYRVLNNFMQDKASRRLEAQLDRRHYDESQLITIKVPVTHLSYYNNSAVFERVDGQIEINGIPYQYVQCRIFNDSLELLCIPNQTVLKLRVSGDDYFKLVNRIIKNFEVDSYTITGLFRIKDRDFTVIKQRNFFLVRLPSTPYTAAERPPAIATACA
jgi:hypothetical protein